MRGFAARPASGGTTSSITPIVGTTSSCSVDEHVDVWLICWNDEQETGFHDHDVSNGAFHVCDGQIVEDRLAFDGPRSRSFVAGESASFDASHVHRLQHVGDEPTVTIHAYSPPLVRMGAYVVREDGVLERRTIPASEELRPSRRPDGTARPRRAGRHPAALHPRAWPSLALSRAQPSASTASASAIAPATTSRSMAPGAPGPHGRQRDRLDGAPDRRPRQRVARVTSDQDAELLHPQQQRGGVAIAHAAVPHEDHDPPHERHGVRRQLLRVAAAGLRVEVPLRPRQVELLERPHARSVASEPAVPKGPAATPQPA